MAVPLPEDEIFQLASDLLDGGPATLSRILYPESDPEEVAKRLAQLLDTEVWVEEARPAEAVLLADVNEEARKSD
jgi:hypothetical protein